jgi:inward rectifier potassium channel
MKKLAKKLVERWRYRSRVYIKILDGRFQVDGMGAWYFHWRDPYHLLLTLPWLGFLSTIALVYVFVSACFAGLYLLEPNSIANARPHSFVDAFFFSVQTLATIGYGVMNPQTVYANIVVTIEAMSGLIGIAVMTGLAFARFSRPTARVLFSQPMIVMPYNQVPTLMFRTANQRKNQILEAQVQVYLMRDEVSLEGQTMRRFYDLKLLRRQTPTFTLSWTIMHPIDRDSPLYEITPELLLQTRTTIVVSISGMDETVMQSIHARHTYTPQDIRWNQRLVDIFYDTANGNRYLDYSCFHETLPLD